MIVTMEYMETHEVNRSRSQHAVIKDLVGCSKTPGAFDKGALLAKQLGAKRPNFCGPCLLRDCRLLSIPFLIGGASLQHDGGEQRCSTKQPRLYLEGENPIVHREGQEEPT